MGQTATSAQNNGGGGEDQAQADDPLLRKFHLFAHQVDPGGAAISGTQVYLRDGKLVLDEPGADGAGHPFCGFFLDYPFRTEQGQKPPQGLVSTISFDPPNLNWIYIHSDTFCLQYGNKTQSLPHITDPWCPSSDGRWLQFSSDRVGFVAVAPKADPDAPWSVHFDYTRNLLYRLRDTHEVISLQLERRLL